MYSFGCPLFQSSFEVILRRTDKDTNNNVQFYSDMLLFWLSRKIDPTLWRFQGSPLRIDQDIDDHKMFMAKQRKNSYVHADEQI